MDVDDFDDLTGSLIDLAIALTILILVLGVVGGLSLSESEPVFANGSLEGLVSLGRVNQ